VTQTLKGVITYENISKGNEAEKAISTFSNQPCIKGHPAMSPKLAFSRGRLVIDAQTTCLINFEVSIS